MGLVADPVLRLSLFFKDARGAVRWRYVSLPAVSLAGAVNFAKTVALLFSDVTNCAIYKIHIMYSFDEEFKPTARQNTVIGKLTDAGVLIFRTEDGNLYSFSIPGIKQSLLVVAPDPLAGIAINQDDINVSAIVSAMIDGISGLRAVAPWSEDDTNEMNWAGDFLSVLECAYKGYEEA